MDKKEHISEQIQTLIEHISLLKETQDSFSKQYKDLSQNFVSVKYREKTFLDKIIFGRYKKFFNDYEKSKQKENQLIELDDNILELQIEIEILEAFLYSLQKQFSDEYPENSLIDKSTPNLENIKLD